ncbi:protein Jade-3 [Brienomyrus brachyistius]|uniref:protein Jade-3 n=1 Tax=Brienomyrus brachyistius TaxID=42636 RepID=UPI0020B27293|nr:protein Jade-3 [Brienomyrus brachyistius]
MKRQRASSSSDSSDNESPSTSFCSSNKYGSKLGTPVSEPKKPAEVFRKDLISAMKLPDSHHISPDDYYLLADPWRQEWEKGVQVLASPNSIPQPSVRVVAERPKEILFSRPRKYIQSRNQDPAEMGYVNILDLAEAVCRCDLDAMDLNWLQELNADLEMMGELTVDELTMERALEALERQCHDNMNHAIETEEGLGIEYDEDVICDVCRSPDSEEGNDMVFCDKCNICVHQACYGILKVPDGCWLCRTCVLGIDPQCVLCPKKGGAMKATRASTRWAHVSCALWIPEVSIACPERMEPITKVSHIPPSRWALVCSLCKLKTGACIQCSVKSCIIPFHVTCAFEHSLEMKTILDEGDEVKFKSYCLKHSKPKAAGGGGLSPVQQKPSTGMEKLGLRARKLRELEEEFYTLVRPGDLARDMALSPFVLDFIFQYWKLKRKSGFNKPLLPPKEEENALLEPKDEGIHTRMRMFMHLRQDLERVRNLCYMVSRREKLKLSHSKAQEQIFNLQVELINQELSAGLPLSCPPESGLIQPPPRITLKLKMPKVTLGNRKTAPKSGNGPLCPDHSANLCEKGSGGRGHGKGWSRRAGQVNGVTPSSREGSTPVKPIRPSGKPLALQAALHGRPSNGSGRPEQETVRSPKPNGSLERPVAQLDSPCQTSCERITQTGPYRKTAMDHFKRSFNEASVSLTRNTEGLRVHDKPPRKGSGKERPWTKLAAPQQTEDGYCPDLELSDSEPETQAHHWRGLRAHRASTGPKGPAPEHGRGMGRGKPMLGPRTSVQR